MSVRFYLTKTFSFQIENKHRQARRTVAETQGDQKTTAGKNKLVLANKLFLYVVSKSYGMQNRCSPEYLLQRCSLYRVITLLFDFQEIQRKQRADDVYWNDFEEHKYIEALETAQTADISLEESVRDLLKQSIKHYNYYSNRYT